MGPAGEPRCIVLFYSSSDDMIKTCFEIRWYVPPMKATTLPATPVLSPEAIFLPFPVAVWLRRDAVLLLFLAFKHLIKVLRKNLFGHLCFPFGAGAGASTVNELLEEAAGR